MSFLGLLFKASYQLRRHEWSGAPLDRWMAVGLVIIAGLMAIRWLPGGVAGIAACGALLFLFIIIQNWAGRNHYIVFEADSAPARHQSGAAILTPTSKLLIRATGLFEVEGRKQNFTELQAYFRSFQTREHAVMALAPPSQVLLIGNWPAHEIGMWYIFFRSHELRHIETGELCFGSRKRPALRLIVEQGLPPPVSPLDVWGGYRGGKPKTKTRRQTIHLSFQNLDDRQRVLANLVADATQLTGE